MHTYKHIEYDFGGPNIEAQNKINMLILQANVAQSSEWRMHLAAAYGAYSSRVTTKYETDSIIYPDMPSP